MSSGHGCAAWIVTYSDMVTLLMACFIMVITFASKEPEKFSKKRDSVMGGEGGSGSAGEGKQTLDHDTIVWRERPRTARLGEGGSEMPSLHSDPMLETTEDILRRLELPTLGTLADSFTVRLPAALLFRSDGKLSESGLSLTHAIAQKVRQLPYDILVEVDDSQYASRAVTLCQRLMLQEQIYPGRLGVGVRQVAQPWNASVWLTYVRQP